jgi:Skp family chaperone for outer membrane proteins
MNITLFSVARLLVLAMLLLGAGTTASAQTTRTKIGFVDFEQVFTNYYKTKLANDQLLEMSDGINREQVRMQIEFEMLQKQFRDFRDEAMQPDLTETNRVGLRKQADESLVAMRRLEERIKLFSKTQQKRWEEQNRRIRNTLINDLREKIARYGKANAFLAIIDRTQADDKGVPAVLYQDEEADLTSAIIEHVNR